MERPFIYEPMTVITDFMITILAIYLARQLTTQYEVTLQNNQWHWIRAFWMLGLGAFLGAVSHGWGPYMPELAQSWIWKVTTISIGFVSFFIIMSTLHVLFPFKTVQLVRAIPVIFLGIYLIQITRNPEFINVIKFYAPAMIFTLIAMAVLYFTKGASGSNFIIAGILISFLAAGIQVSGFSLHKHFNHNDIYHVIQMIGMIFLYRGAQRLTDYITP